MAIRIDKFQGFLMGEEILEELAAASLLSLEPQFARTRLRQTQAL